MIIGHCEWIDAGCPINDRICDWMVDFVWNVDHMICLLNDVLCMQWCARSSVCVCVIVCLGVTMWMWMWMWMCIGWIWHYSLSSVSVVVSGVTVVVVVVVAAIGAEHRQIALSDRAGEWINWSDVKLIVPISCTSILCKWVACTRGLIGLLALWSSHIYSIQMNMHTCVSLCWLSNRSDIISIIDSRTRGHWNQTVPVCVQSKFS